MNLTRIVHPISKQNLDSSRFAAIVRKDAKFRSFDDLKGKRACFTGIKSVDTGSSPRLPCDDVEAVSRFFNRSCVYDLGDREKFSLPENLYSLCNQSQFEKSLGPEENTFKCLMNGADVAFVNVGAAKRYYSGFSIFHMNYRSLYQNEDRLDGEPCFLTETTLGSVSVLLRRGIKYSKFISLIILIVTGLGALKYHPSQEGRDLSALFAARSIFRKDARPRDGHVHDVQYVRRPERRHFPGSNSAHTETRVRSSTQSYVRGSRGEPTGQGGVRLVGSPDRREQRQDDLCDRRPWLTANIMITWTVKDDYVTR
ncbi:unnamed protein product [Trichogramma brassicae]|uniref:Transferrin-like domain-containing protein n=1 Tax=Trichogramma brassicae TaxID=86971 RepID=A0A6H5J9J7_9HYME|nr:unnamed protein product [Trichogramma brassicae]